MFIFTLKLNDTYNKQYISILIIALISSKKYTRENEK